MSPTVFIPGMMHNRVAPAPCVLPSGLGIGINLVMPDHDHEAKMNAALSVLQPHSWYHWRQWPPSSHLGFMPMAAPTPNGGGEPPYPVDAGLLEGFRQAMAAVGGDLATRCWMLTNEPEFSGWTPQQVVSAQIAQRDVFISCGFNPSLLAPNSNITTESQLSFLMAWRDEAARRGLVYTLAIHIYEHRIEMLDYAWQRFTSRHDGSPIVVTECGAGANRTIDEWLLIMPWFYNLLRSGQVKALLPFAAYPQTDGGNRHYPGFLDASGQPNEIGRQWLSYRQHL